MTIFSTLTNRIFVASAALTLLCISTAIYVVNRRVTEAAEDELRRELVQSGVLVDEQRLNVSDLFLIFARAVADLPKLKAAVVTDDPPTVQPLAADYARSVHASLLLVTDHSGRVLADRIDAPPPAGMSGLPSVESALRGREAATFRVSPAGILQVVSVPIGAGAAPPEIIGSLSLGFQLDDALAARLKAQTGSEIAFATGSRVVASTLPRSERGRARRPGDQDGDHAGLVRPDGIRRARETAGLGAAPVDASRPDPGRRRSPRRDARASGGDHPPVAHRAPASPSAHSRGAGRHRRPGRAARHRAQLRDRADDHAPARGHHGHDEGDDGDRGPRQEDRVARQPVDGRGRPPAGDDVQLDDRVDLAVPARGIPARSAVGSRPALDGDRA